MSDSSMRTKPSIDEPSNMMRPSSASSNCRSGTSTFLVAPRMSVNWRRMNLTFSRSARSRMRALRSSRGMGGIIPPSSEGLDEADVDTAHPHVVLAPLIVVAADNRRKRRQQYLDPRGRRVRVEFADPIDREVVEVLDAVHETAAQPDA